MTEIVNIIITYASIWAPSLVSILGIVTTILIALNKTKEQWNKMKEDNDYREIKEKLTANAKQNEELIKCEKALIDNITKIKDYVDHKKEE